MMKKNIQLIHLKLNLVAEFAKDLFGMSMRVHENATIC